MVCSYLERGDEAMAADSKVRKYRIVVLNLAPDDDIVSERVKDDLGNVQIVSWWIEEQIHYEKQDGHGFMLPQHISIVGIEYQEAEG